MKVIYKKRIIDRIEEIKEDAIFHDKIIEKIILTESEYEQALRESHAVSFDITTPSEMICGIPIEVKK